MKSIDDGTINQYKWLKIAQAIILIVLGIIFIVTGLLSKGAINNALSYCLGVVFVVYGTMNVVAGYLLHRTPVNSPVFIGLLSIAFAFTLFFVPNLIADILTPFLLTLLFSLSAMFILYGGDKILSYRKVDKKKSEEEEKVDEKDFEKIKQLKLEKKKLLKTAIWSFLLAALIIALSIVYLVFELTQGKYIEQYLVLCVGILTLVFGIATLMSTLRQIKNTKDMLMEEKMKTKEPTYNDSNEVKNTDVRIIDISELKSRKRKRKSLPKPKPAPIPEENEKKETGKKEDDKEKKTEEKKDESDEKPTFYLPDNSDGLDGD